jgi:mevalonate kinase
MSSIDRVVASAPGKLILMGEHAVVYGRPALVAAVAPRTRASCSACEKDVEVDLPDLNRRMQVPWSQILSLSRGSQERWRVYAEHPTPQGFQELRSDDPSHLVWIALGEVAEELDGDPPPLSLRVESDLPVGSGFGSSAATAVAVVAAALKACGHQPDIDLVDRLVLSVEQRQHGLPSGVDHRTVLHGGLIWAEPDASGALQVTPLASISDLGSRFQVFQTGCPAQGTGEVVAAVGRRRDKDVDGFESLLERMARATKLFRQQFLCPKEDPRRVVDLIKDYEACLEAMGVVPQAVQASIRQVESAGGAAKVSGAGALSGTAAGCLLVYWPPDARPAEADQLAAYNRQALRLGVEGLLLEVER